MRMHMQQGTGNRGHAQMLMAEELRVCLGDSEECSGHKQALELQIHLLLRLHKLAPKAGAQALAQGHGHLCYRI